MTEPYHLLSDPAGLTTLCNQTANELINAVVYPAVPHFCPACVDALLVSRAGRNTELELMAWLEKGFVTTYPDGHAEVYLHGEYTEELEKIIEIMRGIKGTTQPEAREA